MINDKMDEISVNGHGLSAMCRLCLSKGVILVDIFHSPTKSKDHLSNVIMECAPIQIKRRDEIPNFICHICYTQLKKFHHFQKQIVQSDKTLRRYAQQLFAFDNQIKPECSIQKSSKEHKVNKTKHRDIFDTNINKTKTVPIKYHSAGKINEELSSKFKMYGELTDGNSLNKCAGATVETISKGVDSEIVCEDSKIQKSPISGNSAKDCLDNDKRKKNISSNCEKHKKATEKKYHCGIRNKSITKSFNLKTHMRTHSNEKPYQCDFCNKYFSQSNCLNCHKCTHTGEKAYQCDICNMCFRQANNLISHKRTHTGEKPYQCDVCNRCFGYSSSLFNHKTHMHRHIAM